MPSAADFKRKLSLNKGAKLSKDFTIKQSDIGHVSRTQNELYEFPSTVIVGKTRSAVGQDEKPSKQRKIIAELKKTLSNKHQIVYSAYGSPYDCTIPARSIKVNKPTDDETFSFEVRFKGKAVRRRDIPTLSQQKEQKHAKQDEELKNSPEAKKALEGMRVIKSRFGSSKCATCGQAVEVGSKIAKPQGDTSKGGWSHALCIVKDTLGDKKKISDNKNNTEKQTKRKVTSQAARKKAKKLRSEA